MINQQSAAKSTSSTKQHNSFVSYVPTRPLTLDRQTTTAMESGTTATTKHTAYVSPKSLLLGNKYQTMRYRVVCMPLTGFFGGYCLLSATFTWRSLTTGGTIIFPLSFVSKIYSLIFGTPSPHAIKHVAVK